MAYQEAIKVLKNNYPKTAKMVDGRYKGGFDDIESELGRALNMAIEALEKQIPKKPVGKYTSYKCPVCGRRVRSGKGSSSRGIDHYCQKCGQAIDWEETE